MQCYEWVQDTIFPDADVVFLTSNYVHESDSWLLWRVSAVPAENAAPSPVVSTAFPQLLRISLDVIYSSMNREHYKCVTLVYLLVRVAPSTSQQQLTSPGFSRITIACDAGLS